MVTLSKDKGKPHARHQSPREIRRYQRNVSWVCVITRIEIHIDLMLQVSKTLDVEEMELYVVAGVGQKIRTLTSFITKISSKCQVKLGLISKGIGGLMSEDLSPHQNSTVFRRTRQINTHNKFCEENPQHSYPVVGNMTTFAKQSPCRGSGNNAQ